MAWTNLSFPFGSTLTSTQMTQLDDNFDALAAGSSGAPTIQTAALADGVITNAKLGNGSITITKVVQMTAGDVYESESFGSGNTTLTTYTKLAEALCFLGGTHRIVMSTNETSNGLYVRVYKNGVAYGVEHFNNSGGVQIDTEDLSFSAGDLIQIYVRSVSLSATQTLNYAKVRGATVPLFNPIEAHTL